MSRPIIYIGDRNPIITATLYDGSGNPLDIDPGSHTVKFAARLEFDAGNALGPLTGTINQISSGNTAQNKGQVQYVFGSGDLAGFIPGIYWSQWIVYDASLNPMHVSAGQFECRKAG